MGAPKLYLVALLLKILLLVSCEEQQPIVGVSIVGVPAQSLLDRALLLRNKDGATFKELKESAVLLAEAAGLRILRPEVYGLTGLPTPSADSSSTGELLDGFPDVYLSQNPLPAALRELGRAFQEGLGVETHQQFALQLYRKAADLGDAEAQGQMGVRFAFGLQDSTSVSKTAVVQFGEMDEAQAVLHYYFAAAAGDDFSRMALGYRHLHGLGVPKNCWTAAAYYQPVAEQVAGLAAVPGRLPQLERIRLNVQAAQGLRAADRQREVLQFYQYSADRGNVDAQTAVGQVLNYGIHGIQRDHAQALHYFRRAAEAGDVEAMAHLGHMHANGLGTPQSDTEAFEWLEKAAARKSVNGLFGLGYMHLVGQGTKEDHDKAFKHLSQAAEMGHPDAYFFLGVMHLKGLGVKRKNVRQALSYFTLAAHSGNLLAMYNAAMLHLGGKGTSRACKPAVALLKQMAERGPAAVALQMGHEHFFKAQYTQALLSYLRAAEMGLELGQSNAAWMLERGYGHAGPNTPAVAFLLHRRSAEQGNVPSLLAMGDAYFYGQGVTQDWVRSSAIYYEAYQERSAEAMFNLGYMHEFGAGVPKDLQLARRFYLMARATQPDGAAGALIACFWLRLHEIWEAIRPRLPKRLDFLWSRVFVLEAPATSPLGLGVDALLSSLAPQQLAMHWEVLSRRLTHLPGLDAVQMDVEEVMDLGETATAVVLLLGLVYVLNLRRRRAAQPAGAGQAGVLGQPGHPGQPVIGEAWLQALRDNAVQQAAAAAVAAPRPDWPRPPDAQHPTASQAAPTGAEPVASNVTASWQPAPATSGEEHAGLAPLAAVNGEMHGAASPAQEGAVQPEAATGPDQQHVTPHKPVDQPSQPEDLQAGPTGKQEDSSS